MSGHYGSCFRGTEQFKNDKCYEEVVQLLRLYCSTVVLVISKKINGCVLSACCTQCTPDSEVLKS